ncbi:MAG: methyltransferase domain-containing protein [Coriobacteriales bacterium]|jgi:SAM-dependent methyltransferase
MNIASAKDQIKDTVEAYLQKDDAGMYEINPARQRPMFLLGAPGIGKTAIMEQIASELGIGIVSYSMTHHTRQSALGLPRIVHHSYGDIEYDASEYTMSEIVAAVYDYMADTGLTRGILFLDEINCVSETLYPSMLQFLQFKTFGRHKVPDDWVIVCAGNPPEYNRSVHEFDIVTLDRLREIDVEPDYGCWRVYAKEKGLHPAVLTFLEAKPDCFYKVESKTGGGKSFVTARGWEDLAETIALYEKLGKPVNRELIVQFLRDDEIADAFSVYYSLFEKYSSDYQVGRILSGTAGADIEERAKKAEFDERIALIGLMLDMLSTSCQEALEQEDIVLECRDALRAVKADLNAGASVEETLGKDVKKRTSALERKIASKTAQAGYVRRERLTIRRLKDFMGQCTVEHAEAGPEAFTVLGRAYRAEVDKIEPLVDAANSKIDCAFDFIGKCFTTNRELLVFMAELSARRSTTQFIARYGNDKYYAHNDELQVDAARSDLSKRIQELDAIETPETLADGLGPDMGGGVGIGRRGHDDGYLDGISKVSQEKEASQQKAAIPDDAQVDEKTLAEFYLTREFEYGFASMSRMTLPVERIRSKKVLDVCCRRGKGVYKLSAKVGQDGHATGVDPSGNYIEEARAGIERATHDNHLKRPNMDFFVGYPENLITAGIGDGSYDVVYINNVMTLVYSIEESLKEFYRVIKPGGFLICETVFSDRVRDPKTIEAAREIGNSIQAALTKDEFFELVEKAGFAEPEVVETYPVNADRGYKPSEHVDTVSDDSGATFSAVAMYIGKPRK